MVVAGHAGDHHVVRAAGHDPDGGVRAAVLGARSRLGDMGPGDLVEALHDTDVRVRRRAIELVARIPPSPPVPGVGDELDETIVAAARVRWTASPDEVELASWCLGERHARPDDPEPMAPSHEAEPAGVPRSAPDAVLALLIDAALTHPDALCREAAVAALGSIGDRRGLPAILRGCSDKATVRRRAVVALAPFEGPEVDAALRLAATDRDWQVRQIAEDLLAD